MKIQFIGVGSAFTTPEYYQSNALVISNSGKKLLIDCGSDARFGLAELGMNATDLDAIYISHLHADHVGGMEWLAFCTYFIPNVPRPKLYCNNELMEQLWEQALRGGLESIQGYQMNLTSYFDCHSIPENGTFRWEGINFIPVQTVHVMSGYTIKYSYGLLINESDQTGDTTVLPKKALTNTPIVFFSTDTQFCPNQIRDFYKRSDLIFHDCETGFKSGVHAHYEDLATLDNETKEKMWLYHYQPNPKQNPQEDGFQGFVKKGQIFDI